jgi:uncharacterized membrane-anchored protein
MASLTATIAAPNKRHLLSKVPEVTIFFWIIKVLCTTVGESAADYLNYNLGWGLSGTSVATGLLLVVALAVQLSLKRYIPGVYWWTVVLVSVFGTLVTDNLTDDLGVALETSTVVFSVLLGLTFLAWYLVEGTLSIHSVFTLRRECFYWLTVLVTFALGTATGDLVSEGLGVGYFWTGVLVAGLIATTALAWKLGLNAILAFWIVYILTRPLGASIGDFMAQPTAHGGLGLGVTVTSVIFLVLILVTVTYLAITKKDVITDQEVEDEIAAEHVDETTKRKSARAALWQTVIVVALVVVVGGTGYAMRMNALEGDSGTVSSSGSSTSASTSPLGDLSQFTTITQDTLNLLNAGDQAGATKRIDDLEYAWDQNAARLQAKDLAAWHAVDDKIDVVLRDLRSTTPNATDEKAALIALLAVLK